MLPQFKGLKSRLFCWIKGFGSPSLFHRGQVGAIERGARSNTAFARRCLHLSALRRRGRPDAAAAKFASLAHVLRHVQADAPLHDSEPMAERRRTAVPIIVCHQRLPLGVAIKLGEPLHDQALHWLMHPSTLPLPALVKVLILQRHERRVLARAIAFVRRCEAIWWRRVQPGVVKGDEAFRREQPLGEHAAQQCDGSGVVVAVEKYEVDGLRIKVGGGKIGR
eukprot:scaffold82068_cov75-Phaeocystis_antarctica.AAC.1